MSRPRGRGTDVAARRDHVTTLPPRAGNDQEVEMKALAVLIGLLLTVLGIATLVAPALLVGIGHHAATPVGLWLVAVARLAIGAVLYNAAKTARTPTALRILGSLFIASG